MTKNTMKSIYAYLNGDTSVDVEALRTALGEEIAKDEEKAAANRALYEEAHDIVIQTITGVKMTMNDLWDAIASKMPEGMTRSKIQYALTHYWESDVVREKDADGKVNTYTAA